MLDIIFIRQNTDLVKKAVQDKGIDLNINVLLEVDEKRRKLISQVDEIRRERNTAALERNIEKGKEIKSKLSGLEADLNSTEARFQELMLLVPNIPSPDSPKGLGSSFNKVISKQGEIPKFDFKVKDHLELGKLLDIIDVEQGSKASGFRGYYLKNEGAILHWALLQFAFKKIIDQGFVPMVPPTLLKEGVLLGSGHFPFGRENVYQISNSTPIYLAGTSEPALLGYFMEKTLSEDELPIKVCALTQCYRSEVGDYGKDVRGLYRLHEFTKVEQVVICKNDLAESEKFFVQMQSISEEILKDLGLPYQIIQTSTGDMGAGKWRMNDIETWMAGRGKYGETHSNSNLTDWQARRLNLKYKTKDGQTLYCYTLNDTVLASPRILIPILENNQLEDGTVKIPEVLLPYTHFSEIKPKIK